MTIAKISLHCILKLKHHLNHNLSHVPNFSRVSLLEMNKFNLKNTAVGFQDNLNDTSNFRYCQWYSMALAIIESKIFKPAISKVRRKTANICELFS